MAMVKQTECVGYPEPTEQDRIEWATEDAAREAELEAWMEDRKEQDEHDSWQLDCDLREMDHRGILSTTLERMLKDGWSPRWEVLKCMAREYERQKNSADIPF